MGSLKYMTDYQTLFDTSAFLDTFFGWTGTEKSNGILEFRLREHHKFWSTIQPTWSKDGATILEFGGGPTVGNLISATNKANHIIFSEYAESNRKAVSSWIEGEAEAHDWSSMIRYVVKQLEGNFKDEAVSLREQQMKDKIKSVVPCDMTKCPVVDINEVFDVVSTSFCVEECSSSFEEYKSAISKLGKLIKPGGYLHMAGNLKESFYVVGKHKFRVLPLTREMVEEAMEDARMPVVNFEIMELDDDFTISDAQAVFSVDGRKAK